MDEEKIESEGWFKYEEVKGEKDNDIGIEKVKEEVKEERWNRLMEKKKKI